MKHVLITENGDVEFGSFEELTSYFKGENVEVERISDGKYRAKVKTN